MRATARNRSSPPKTPQKQITGRPIRASTATWAQRPMNFPEMISNGVRSAVIKY